METEDFYNHFPRYLDSPHILTQAAADPKHPNKWPN